MGEFSFYACHDTSLLFCITILLTYTSTLGALVASSSITTYTPYSFLVARQKQSPLQTKPNNENRNNKESSIFSNPFPTSTVVEGMSYYPCFMQHILSFVAIFMRFPQNLKILLYYYLSQTLRAHASRLFQKGTVIIFERFLSIEMRIKEDTSTYRYCARSTIQ